MIQKHGGGPKRIISSTGNEYQLDEIKLGDKLNTQKSFVADIPVSCVFSASKVNEKIDFIAKLEVYFRDRFTMELRNIKVK